MRRIRHCVALSLFWAALAALVVTLPGARAQQTNRQMMYFVQGEKYPKGLSDFQAFGLSRETKGGHTKWSGWMMADRGDPNGSTRPMSSVRVDGARLRFTVKARKMQTITFDGRFLRRGDFSKYVGKDVPVIEGVLRKTSAGEKAAEAKMTFVCARGG